jgi:hypothetical protein
MLLHYLSIGDLGFTATGTTLTADATYEHEGEILIVNLHVY